MGEDGEIYSKAHLILMCSMVATVANAIQSFEC